MFLFLFESFQVLSKSCESSLDRYAGVHGLSSKEFGEILKGIEVCLLSRSRLAASADNVGGPMGECHANAE